MINEPIIESMNEVIAPKAIQEGYLIYPDGRVLDKKGKFLQLKVGAAGYVILNTWCNYQENTLHALRLMNDSGSFFKLGQNKPKKVYCPEDGVVYQSITDAGRMHGIDRTTVKTYIKTQKKTRTGMSFQWYLNQKEDKQ